MSVSTVISTPIGETYDVTTMDSTLDNTTTLVPPKSTLDIAIYIYVVPIVFGLITLVGTVGNMLVIYVIVSHRRMRTAINLMLLNLAVADLCFIFFCVPFTAYVFANDAWPFSDVMCRIMHYIINVTAYVTVYTLVIISIVRFVTIVHNKHINKLYKVTIMCIATWVIMLFLNIPILFSFSVHHRLDHPFCEIISNDYGRGIYTTFFVFAYLLPLLLIVALTSAMLCTIYHRPSTIAEDSARSHDMRRQATRVLVLIVVVFAVCWGPITVYLLVYYFTLPSFGWFQYLNVPFQILAYLNSCVNPIIYDCASSDFRRSFRSVIHHIHRVCVKRKCVNPENMEKEAEDKELDIYTKETTGGALS